MKIPSPLAVALVALALAACGNSGDESSPGPATPPIRKPTVSKFDGVRIGHILIAKDGRGHREPRVTRTKADALALAKSLLADIRGGRDFMEVARAFSEDTGANNQLNTNCAEPGAYEGPAIEGFDPAWKDAALKTPVGTVNPDPVESEQYGYFLIKRLK